MGNISVLFTFLVMTAQFCNLFAKPAIAPVKTVNICVVVLLNESCHSACETKSLY